MFHPFPALVMLLHRQVQRNLDVTLATGIYVVGTTTCTAAGAARLPGLAGAS